MMSVRVQDPALFFLTLPDLMMLCGISLTLQDDEGEPRTKQIRTCRDLLLLFSDVLASPALDSFTDITAVMAIPFFQKGVVQAFGRRHRLKVSCPQIVSPGVLQCCLSFSLVTRLSPRWNKAGRYLVSGQDFLSERGRLNAVSLEVSTAQGQMCFSIEANAIRLPPTTLQDLDLPPLVLRRFCSDPGCVLDLWANGRPLWCHVLPSMKKGQIMSISRQLPNDGPFRAYRDLQTHWTRLYGYRLPDVPEDDVVYCSVYFRPLGDKLFTYPLSCVRMQPVQRYPRGDLQGALNCFLSDLREKLQKVCGLSTRLTSQPCHPEVQLSTAPTAQVSSGSQVNLSSSSSMRPVLTQLPASPSARPLKPFFTSQPPSWAPPSQSLSSSDSSGFHPPSSAPPPVFQPSSSPSSTSVATPLPPPVNPPPPPPKLVPIFKNRHPFRHVNVALLRVQRQKDLLNGGGKCRGRVTLPAVGTNTSSIHVSSSLPVPSFSHPHKTPPRSSRVKFVPSFTPSVKPKPALVLTVKPDSKMKPQEDLDQTSAAASSSSEGKVEPPSDPSSSSKQGAVKCRPPVKDVEKMARRNQLWKVNSVTLRLWLRGRGVDVDAKLQKAELMLKVMGCLAEA